MRLDTTDAYLLLGSNMGDSKKILETATAMIAQQVGYVKAISSFYATEAWGKTDQPAFINQALMVNTALTARQLLDTVLAIEQKIGRVRIEKWGARLIDIDIIFFGNEIINQPDLVVPHPYMHVRRFVLLPMEEIAPGFLHPVHHKSIKTLNHQLDDDLSVVKLAQQ